MKKLILFAAGALLLAACSKKQDAKPAPDFKAKFAGTWTAVIDSVYNTDGGVTKGSVLTYNGDYTWTLNADGTGQIQQGGTAMPVTFTANTADKLNLTIAAVGNDLQEVINFNVVTLSANKMTLSVSLETSKEVIYFTKK